MGVECWCDFGANLVQHFMRRYSRYSRYRTKSHDKATISHDILRYSRYQTVLLKLQEIISTFGLLSKTPIPQWFSGFSFFKISVLVQIWCNTLLGDTHDIHDIAQNHTKKLRYHTIFYDIHDIKRYC